MLRRARLLFRVMSICVLLAAFFSTLPCVIVQADTTPAVEFAAGALADYYADSMYQSSVYGTRLALYVGNSVDRVQNRSGPARIYIQFDLSMIPRRARIVSAEMALYQMYAPASSQTFEVHVVESAWAESSMDWENQPASNKAVVSATLAPTESNVWVAWNVTSAVLTWLNGGAPNYGFMIRIKDERTGAANEASGFYSREYPKQDLTPRLRVLCQNQPPFTFLVSTQVAGLPPELTSRIISDTNQTITVHGEEVGYMLFESGRTHTIRADEYVAAGNSTRYHAMNNSIGADRDREFRVTYEPQFLVTVKSDPLGLIEREWSEWYDRGTPVETPLAREVAEEQEDTRLVLDGWYVNDARQPGNTVKVTVNEPTTATARYKTLYNVTTSSPHGTTSGSGWHPAGSSVDISVTPTYVPSEGILGYLGFGSAFDHWTGSFESTSPTMTLTVDRPFHVTAIWREDRTWFVVGIGVAIALSLVLATFVLRSKRSKHKERLTGHRKLIVQQTSRPLEL